MTTEVRENQKPQLQMQPGVENTRSRHVFLPRADIYESKDQITVVADMPGVDQTSVDITLEKSVLNINGTVFPQDHSGYTLAYCEYEVGDYRRMFTLPNEIDREGIQALVKSGVLKLTLPKSKAALPKKITVKGE